MMIEHPNFLSLFGILINDPFQWKMNEHYNVASSESLLETQSCFLKPKEKISFILSIIIIQ